jgi:hypothetical protein
MAQRNRNALYIEPNGPKSYKATWGGSPQPVKVSKTQQRAIEAAHKLAPAAPVHVARVRDTKYGHRDQFRRVH